MKNKFGTVTFEGIQYVLTQDAYPEYRSTALNPYIWWSASAVREDELDEDGEPSTFYRVWWREEEADDVDKTNANEPSDYIDWDDIVDVEAV